MIPYLDNKQYRNFVNFAEQQMNAGNEKAIARAIEAAVGDKVAPWGRRSQDNKDANNETRRLFREAVADKVVHGNFNELPQDFQTGLNEIVDDLRKVFGEAAVPKNSVLSDILNPRFVKKTVEGQRDGTEGSFGLPRHGQGGHRDPRLQDRPDVRMIPVNGGGL